MPHLLFHCILLLMRIAIDTGGTFTDAIYLEGGVLKTNKFFSTPPDPSLAILEITSGIEITSLIHGSTVGTNAFLERKGAKIAFLTTAGFEDILFIGRQTRAHLYDLSVEKPSPIVRPENCLGVRERIDARGNVITALSQIETKRLFEHLKKKEIEAIAVCLLHAYLYPHHERLLKSALLKLGHPLSISSEILPEFREYERASTTAINAYLSPVMSRYLNRLKQRLPQTTIYIQQSNGGWFKAKEAARLAAHTVLSGPAGGVSGAFMWAQDLGEKRIITFDMGGTSTDVCLIDGRIPFTKEYVLDGFPLSIPVIDIHTVGAGGGSIAYIDMGGALKVGPESAGADPGPACYGKGEKPTVTDANLVLGRILPDCFLGGRFRLQKDRSQKAIFPLAQRMQLSLEEAALGIIKVANVNMIRALRKVSLERGYNPKEFSLFCFGGAGGLHACSLAKELGVKRILIPKLAGGLSAFGLLFAPPLKDFSRTIWLKAQEKERLFEIQEQLKKEALLNMKKMGFRPQEFQEECFLDMRYQGQGYELSIPFCEDYISAFEEMHRRQFGYTCPDFPIEIVIMRLRLKGRPPEDKWTITKENNHIPLEITKVFTEQGWIEAPVIDWNHLHVGDKFKGPAVIVEPFTTVWIEPLFRAEVEENYTLSLALSA